MKSLVEKSKSLNSKIVPEDDPEALEIPYEATNDGSDTDEDNGPFDGREHYEHVGSVRFIPAGMKAWGLMLA